MMYIENRLYNENKFLIIHIFYSKKIYEEAINSGSVEETDKRHLSLIDR